MPQRCRDVPEKQLDAHYASSYGIFAGKTQTHRRAALHPGEGAGWRMNTGIRNSKAMCLKMAAMNCASPTPDPRELVMDILKHGADVEVISPESLRNAVAEHLQNALGRYR